MPDDEQESGDTEARKSARNEGHGRRRRKKRPPWWQNPTTVTFLVAIVAATAPLTTAVRGWFDSRNELELQRSKQLNELRQKYLDRVLSDVQSQRMLTFLCEVEDDGRLKAWAMKQLSETEARLKSKSELYQEAIHTVATLANHEDPIRQDSPSVKRFWTLYNVDLLHVESREVEAMMVRIGRELHKLVNDGAKPSPELKNLSFELAGTMKSELLPRTPTTQASVEH